MRPIATLVRSGMCRTPGTGVHRPAPTLFFFPGLTSKAVWDPAQFPFLRELTENIDSIEKEYEAVSSSLPSDYAIKADEHTLHKGNWEWRSLVSKGKLQPPFQVLAPTTSAILQSFPSLLVGPPFAYSFFSTLHVGTKIEPHYGPCNIRLRVHLPLRVPAGPSSVVGMRIAGQEMVWERGKPIVFDDTYEHSVWNQGDRERVVLLFDLWHPELESSERQSIGDMFEDARRKGWLT
jgi:aspartyl/asparaginyl beta-hydroxylase (cupin superfamily)